MEAMKVKWELDPAQSEIAFKAEQYSSTYVKGIFRNYEAGIYSSGTSPKIYDIDLKIDAASVHTGQADRDTHLKSADFFDVKNFKYIIFSGKTKQKSENLSRLELNGDLTIKGISKQVALNVETLETTNHTEFSVNGMIRRSDWGLNWNAPVQSGGLLIEDEVIISCMIILTPV